MLRLRCRRSVIAALLATLSVAGCDDADPELAEPDGTYTVRGQVRELGSDTLAIHHEAIPGFRNREGEISGMDSMVMLFFRPEAVPLEGIAIGDPVELTFDVRWSGAHTLTLTAIRELPAETTLELTQSHH